MFKASHRHARISAFKVRPIADIVRGMAADEALETLRYQTQRGARMLEQVIRSAVGNAEDQSATGARGMKILEVRVDEGPSFFRFAPRARGSAHRITKRLSHIHVVIG